MSGPKTEKQGSKEADECMHKCPAAADSTAAAGKQTRELWEVKDKHARCWRSACSEGTAERMCGSTNV